MDREGVMVTGDVTVNDAATLLLEATSGRTTDPTPPSRTVDAGNVDPRIIRGANVQDIRKSSRTTMARFPRIIVGSGTNLNQQGSPL